MTDKNNIVLSNGKRIKYVNIVSEKSTKSVKSKKSINDDQNDWNETKLIRLTDQSKEGTPNPTSIYTNTEEIAEKLKFYKRIDTDNIKNIPLGIRIKYIEILDNKKYKYKEGGTIIVNKAPEYIMLAAKRKSWSVQLNKHIIFIEQFQLVRKEYEQKIKELQKNLDRQIDANKTLKDRNVQLIELLKTNNINPNQKIKKTKKNK
jgi:hypothetical protein